MPDNLPVQFQRRHFVAIAELIRTTDSLTPFQRKSLAIEWSLKLAGTNTRFNADNFVTSATEGLPEEDPAYVPPVVPEPTATAFPNCTVSDCHNVAYYRHAGITAERFYCRNHGGGACCQPLDPNHVPTP